MRKTDQTRYVGIDRDINGGMTDTGRIIRDAWAFGIIDETETCEGWLPQGIEDLWRKVNEQWERYGFRVGGLPDDIRQRYLRIQDAAVRRARASGWDPELDDED
jgi:hypothetical protein